MSNEREMISEILASDTSHMNGDDAALVAVPGASALVTTDITVEGVHTPHDFSPYERGRWATSRALSDIAAMGGRPRAVVAALSVPHSRWHEVPEISRGIRERARACGCDLVGGDLSSAAPSGVHAPSSICITCIGTPAAAGARLLSGARPGDVLAVTGTLGRASCGWRDIPDRIEAGARLAPVCTSMTDISDGIVEEVRTMAVRSAVHVTLNLDVLPLDPQVSASDPLLQAATWGDDYELLVTMAPQNVAIAHDQLTDLNIPLTVVGSCADGSGVTMLRDGVDLSDNMHGFAH